MYMIELKQKQLKFVKAKKIKLIADTGLIHLPKHDDNLLKQIHSFMYEFYSHSMISQRIPYIVEIMVIQTDFTLELHK